MQEAKAKGIVDGHTPIVMASQMAGVKDNGAPKKSDSEISESGSQTRDDGGNLGKGGKS
jgi:hypothetical protein